MNPNTEPLYRLVGHELCQERTPHPETQIMKLTLTIEVEYDPGTTNQRELMGILHDAAFHLAGEGLLTGESDATVEHWKATVS